jgi:ADP-ribose pyrophosphatase YjhB (NUDIX family)
MRLRQYLGIAGFWLAWPAFYVYLARSERTRIVVMYQGRVLVIKNWLSDGRWSLPGGGLHTGEPPVIGAARELCEETGVAVKPEALQLLGGGRYQLHGLHYPFQSFVVMLQEEPELHRQRIEVSEIRWMDPRTLDSKTTSPDVLDSLALLKK